VADGWLKTEPFPDANQEALSGAALAKKERSFKNAHRHGYLNQDDEKSRPALRVPNEVLSRMLG
jgi:hypothetical protein